MLIMYRGYELVPVKVGEGWKVHVHSGGKPIATTMHFTTEEAATAEAKRIADIFESVGDRQGVTGEELPDGDTAAAWPTTTQLYSEILELISARKGPRGASRRRTHCKTKRDGAARNRYRGTDAAAALAGVPLLALFYVWEVSLAVNPCDRPIFRRATPL
jgi:hypothetical protein